MAFPQAIMRGTSLGQLNYDTQGRVSEKVLPTGSGLKELYTYDSLDRLDTITVKNATTNAQVFFQDYGYDLVSNITSHNLNGTTTTYTYDAIDQLLTESRTGYGVTYTYDANGNRATKALTGGSTEVYAYDLGDKLETVKVNGSTIKSYTYDNLGRTTQITAGSDVTTFTWNEDSRITAINLPGSTPDPSYAYNGMGTRVSRSLTGNNQTWKRSGAGVTAPVISDSGATYVPGISEKRSGTTTYSHHGMKNEQAQSTGSTVGATRTYDAFGATTASSGT